MAAEFIPAPPGWGWRPGARLNPPSLHDLPELPLIRVLRAPDRLRVLEQALGAQRDVALQLSPDLMARHYGVARASMRSLLDRLRCCS